MGIFRKSANWLKGGIEKSNEKSRSRRAESDKDSQGNSEAAAIAADQLATAKKTQSVYRDVPTEALLARERDRLEQAQLKTLLQTLKARFEDPDNMRMRHPSLEWEDIQAKLEASPDKLWSLNEMERTGGEPDVVGFENGEYIFMDCSAESPEGRRNCVYDSEGEIKLKKVYPGATCNGNAVSMAALMGVDILSEKEYRELQTKGEFDKNSWSWVKAPFDKRDAGVALFGSRNDFVFIRERDPYAHVVNRAFRASLRLK